MKRGLYHRARAKAIARASQASHKRFPKMSPDLSLLPILETQRMRLTPLVSEDTQYIFPLMADAEVMAFWDVGEIDDPDLIGNIVEGQVEEMAEGRAIYWAMRALGDPDVLPLGDLGVRHGLERLGIDARTADVRWRPWRSYATHLLWAGASATVGR